MREELECQNLDIDSDIFNFKEEKHSPVEPGMLWKSHVEFELPE